MQTSIRVTDDVLPLPQCFEETWQHLLGKAKNRRARPLEVGQTVKMLKRHSQDPKSLEIFQCGGLPSFHYCSDRITTD
jgi:hypothetical protein